MVSPPRCCTRSGRWSSSPATVRSASTRWRSTPPSGTARKWSSSSRTTPPGTSSVNQEMNYEDASSTELDRATTTDGGGSAFRTHRFGTADRGDPRRVRPGAGSDRCRRDARSAELGCRQGARVRGRLPGLDGVGRGGTREAPVSRPASAKAARAATVASPASGVLNVGQIVAAQARLQPDKIGARDSKRALTFAQWNERSNCLANALLGLGLVKGDRVAVLAYNCIEWLEIYVALAKAGLVAVPINFRLTAPEIEYIVGNCEASAMVVQDALLESIDPVRPNLPLIAKDAWVHFGGPRTPRGWRGYESLVRAGSARAPAVEVAPTDTWALMYTWGTTGRPKGAIRNHQGSALISLVTALDMGLARQDTGLLVMPMCHANSLYFSFTFTYLGATCVSTTAAASTRKRCCSRWRSSMSLSHRWCRRTTS